MLKTKEEIKKEISFLNLRIETTPLGKDQNKLVNMRNELKNQLEEIN